MKIFKGLLLLFLADKLSAERNIAQGKTASQSSTSAHYVAGFAVDGNIQTSSRTLASPAPFWWKVDLQIPEKIDSIQIHFGIMYSVKSSVFVSLDGNTWSLAKLKDSNRTSASYTTPNNKHHRYVRVESNNQALVITEVEIYRQPFSTEERTHIPFKPSFVSEWYDIESQSSSKSGITIKHDLNSTPFKVIADVKVQANNTEYIFQGFGSAQTDDDAKQYGGVVVLYDEHKVLLSAPKANNGNKNYGKVIYLGSKFDWTGPDITRTYDKAKVRVRAWKNTDFPEPSFSSNWIYIKTGTGVTDTIYSEVHHSMNEYPDLVVVQVKIRYRGNNYWFEGQGSTSVIDIRSGIQAVSGAVFGYSERSVRIWFANKKIGIHYPGYVFHVSDGWGGVNFAVKEGHYKVRTWKFKPTALYSIEKYQKEPIVKLPFALSLQHMMVQVQFKVNEGLHSGFRFDGVGSSMHGENAYGPYGGLIYGINDKNILMWIPTIGGYIFDFEGMWGKNAFHQATNNVNISVQILTLFEREDLLCRVDKEYFPFTTVQEVIYGTELTSECLKGQKYKSGDKLRTCQRNGNWSNSTIVCEEITCPVDNLVIPNTVHNITGNKLTDSLIYQCTFGFRQSDGNLTRICQEDSTWSGKSPVCKEIACPIHSLAIPNTVHNITGNKLTDSLIYQCKFGFRQSDGNLTRICQEDSTWSGKSPVCKAIECPVEMKNGTAALVNITGNQYMDKATYVCPIHHRQGGGDVTRLCLSNSTWSGEPLICNRCRCPCRNETSDEIKILMEQTKKQLTLDKQELTRFILKKISAKDDRIVAKGIGMTGGCILIVLFIVILLIDAPVLYRQCKQAIKRLCRC